MAASSASAASRAPAESTSQIIGTRSRRASSRSRATLRSPTGPMLPPCTVKSYEATQQGRPSMSPVPQTTPSAGEGCSDSAGSLPRSVARRPISTKLPGSSKRPSRARASSLPRSRWRRSRSSPPIRSASALRRRSSSSFSRIDMFAGALAPFSYICSQRIGNRMFDPFSNGGLP